MLRRDLRDMWSGCSPSQDQKDKILEVLLENRPREVEMRGAKWRAKGQAGSWIAIIIAMLLVIGAAGYALVYFGVTSYIAELFATEPSEPKSTLDSLPSTTETIPTQTQPQQLSYQPLAAKYVQAIQEDWDMMRCEQEDISYLVMFLDKPEDLNCAFVDLDGNGVQEMIVTDGNVIYDLYTCADGEFVHIITGAERNSYSLTADNMIVNVGSGGAGNTVYRIFLYYGNNLIPVELIVCDASKDPQNPWFRGIDDVSTVEPITEKMAREIIDMYPSAPIPGTVITVYD